MKIGQQENSLMIEVPGRYHFIMIDKHVKKNNTLKEDGVKLHLCRKVGTNFQSTLCITHGSRGIGIDGSKISMSANQRTAHCKVLK